MAKRYRHQCPQCNVVRECHVYGRYSLHLDEHHITCPSHGNQIAAVTTCPPEGPVRYETARQIARRKGTQ